MCFMGSSASIAYRIMLENERRHQAALQSDATPEPEAAPVEDAEWQEIEPELPNGIRLASPQFFQAFRDELAKTKTKV